MADNVWNPRFKVGETIRYLSQLVTIKVIDYHYKTYGFTNGLWGSGEIIDDGLKSQYPGVPDYEPATLVMRVGRGGRKTRRNSKKKKSIHRKYRKT